MMGRPDLFVIGRLLEAMATSPGPVRRTPLQQKAGLNYTVFQRYLDYLLRQGLIAATLDPEDLLQLTPKGVERTGSSPRVWNGSSDSPMGHGAVRIRPNSPTRRSAG